MSLDELLSEAKSFGLFQAMATVLVHGTRGLVGWSMLTMSFAGEAPDWHCANLRQQQEQQSGVSSSSGAVPGSNGSFPSNATAKTCPVNASQSCELEFSADRNTIVSEWGLVCGQAWVPNVVTSVQMAGVLVGAMASGQLGDLLGRRWTHFVTLLLHTALNIGAGFSTSWQMFIVFRFLLGATIGSVLVAAMTYTLELSGPSKRAVIPFVPAWSLGVMAFALAAWLLHDWSQLHWALAALHLPFLLAFFMVPESPRWLLVQGRVDQAEKCLATIARFNRVPVPKDAHQRLAKLSEEFKQADKDVGTVTYLDLVLWKDARVPTLVFSFMWFTSSLVFYGLSFSAGSLAGNIYLNIFLLSAMEIPGFLPTFLLSNKIGRRWTVALWFFIITAASVCIIIFRLTASEGVASLAVVVLALIAKAGISSCWLAQVNFLCEIYPTKIRGVAYGWANTAARVGGILAPFVINMRTQTRLLISYAVVGAITLLSGALCLLLKETLGQAYKDTLNSLEVNVEATKEAAAKDAAPPASENAGKTVTKELAADQRFEGKGDGETDKSMLKGKHVNGGSQEATEIVTFM